MDWFQIAAIAGLVYISVLTVFISRKKMVVVYFMLLPLLIVPFLLLFGLVYLFSLMYNEHKE